MKTTLTYYDFNISSLTEKEAYKELTAKLKKTNGKCFRTFPNPTGKRPTEGEVNLDVSNIRNIWGNQWNTTEGFRVFDWYEAVMHDNENLKVGYYLDVTPEMESLRDELLRCGFCGHTVNTLQSFCTTCIGSTYLDASDLKLLRMMPVSSSAPREDLSEDELAILTEEYNKAKVKAIHREYSAEEQNKQFEEEYKLFRDSLEKAQNRFTGYNFLLDNNICQENCIYYDHTGVFCFGWRRPLSDAAADYLEEMLEGFPAKYEITRQSSN